MVHLIIHDADKYRNPAKTPELKINDILPTRKKYTIEMPGNLELNTR